MSQRLLAALAALILVVGLLAGCGTGLGIYPNPATGPVTVSGLPRVFTPGIYKVGCFTCERRVDGLIMTISPAGEVAVSQDGRQIPSQIRGGEIVLGGSLEGVRIHAEGHSSFASIVAYGQGLDVSGDLGQFFKGMCP